MIEVEYINGMNLGLGYNSFTNTVHPSSALENIDKIRPVVQATGQKVSFQVELLSNSISIYEQLKISASASLTYAITSNGSAKASFANTFKQNTYTVYVLVRVHVQNQQTLLDLTSSKLSDKSALLYATDIKNFSNIYGNCFVYGILSGGDYYGILEIESKSAEEYREIKANLSGKTIFGVMNGEAAGSFEQALEKITSSYKMKATVLREGSEGGLQHINPDQLIKDALGFPAQVLEGKGVPFSVLVLPYDQIPHPSAQPLETVYSLECLEKLGRIYERFNKYKNDLQYALDNKELFPGIDTNKINIKLNSIQEEINKIKSNANKFLRDPSQCVESQINEELLDNIIPKQVTPSKLGYKWYWEMGGWFGVFNRRDESNVFEGEFKLGNDIIKSTMEIHETGLDVYIVRKDNAIWPNSPNNTVYKGTFSEEGNKAIGVDLKDKNIKWSAKIEIRV